MEYGPPNPALFIWVILATHLEMYVISHCYSYRASVRKSLGYLWLSYSKPKPQSTGELLTLIVLCFIIAVVTDVLLFSWMSGALQYDRQKSTIAAVIYFVTVFPLSILVHPLRCSFTLMLPSLCTSQGRKLILSACITMVVLNVLPSMASNVSAFMHILKCNSENLAKSLIDSSDLLNRVKTDVISETTKVDQAQGNFVQKMRHFDQSIDVNLTEVKKKFVTVSKRFEEMFSQEKHFMEEMKLLSSRILALIFVLYLFFVSVNYLKSYLTSAKFDNVYITGQLRKVATSNGIQIEEENLENELKSTSYKMTKQELWRCLVPTLLILLYCAVTFSLVFLDYLVYSLVKQSIHLLDIPPTTVNINIQYTEPNAEVVLLLACLYLLSFIMTLLEVYARRLRRKVASGFFQNQEEKRIEYLYKKILARRSTRRQGIYSIETQQLS
ncbi:osteoclast stimulatory transmembrane protein [Chanos chanos]|uniref:Osteoclast stimulatory transmembrane protein n=1 Tax=Chanos chanos TaxID=29144 RepID=A0A6J2W6J6_CHACN|nr:osteoclast stimulatory transmembrane protein-like [Chanos chanos]